MAKIHAYIISALKADMPRFFGKGRKKKELIKNLPILFKKIMEEHLVTVKLFILSLKGGGISHIFHLQSDYCTQVSASDIPPVESMQEKLRNCDFKKFPLLKDKLTAAVDSMLDKVVFEKLQKSTETDKNLQK